MGQLTKQAKKKIWKEYYNQFANQIKSMLKTSISSAIIEISTKNFADDTAMNILYLLRNNPIKVKIDGDKYSFSKPDIEPINFSLYQLFFVDNDKEELNDIERLKETLQAMDFKQTSNTQNLIIYCAYLEGFSKQSIVNLARVDNAFREYITKDKYNQLEKLFRITLDVSEGDIQNIHSIIKQIFGIRNIYTHNNGIVDSRFIDFTGNNKVPKGNKFPLDSTFLNDIYSLLAQSILSIFLRLSEKYFGIPRKELKELSYSVK